MADLKAFLRIPRQPPPARPVATRRLDWSPMHDHPTPGAVSAQASRCMGCGVPFCQSGHGCPVENLIPDWNELASRGAWRDALELLHGTNNFPEFTGHLCPAPCESACVLNIAEAPVTIKQIEAEIIEQGFRHGWVDARPPACRREERVAVVGSGPAGLTVAQQLARLGYAVTVFERSDRPGGLLRYGIPDFKMEKRLIDRRLAQLEEEGVRFRTGVDVGRDVSLASLQAEFDAICLAIGAEQARDLEVPGRELAGVYPAMDYLTRQNRVLAGLPVEHKISAAGLKVAILGGGDTGADCLGTAIRQGCKDVLQLELTGKPPLARDAGRPWPLLPMTLTTSPAHEEGGRRRWNVATTGLSGRDGRVEWLHGVELRQEGGRLKPLPGSEFTLPVDLVLLAIGFTGVAASFPAGQEGLARTPVGTLSTDGSYMTSVPGIFAAGDARRGASLIVWAIAEGRKAAAAIDRYLQGGGGTRH